MNVMVVDVGIGNIMSVVAALDFLGVDYRTVSDPAQLTIATHLILPGVGSFRAGMQALHAAGMVEPIREFALVRKKPTLGICLGMQLLAEHSEEGDCAGLGLVPARIELMSAIAPSGGRPVKVPHVGFSTLYGFRAEGLFDELPPEPDFYFTHSFALKSLVGAEGNIAKCTHGEEFVAAFQFEKLCGAQFHPEKSQTNGLRFLKNFLTLDS